MPRLFVPVIDSQLREFELDVSVLSSRPSVPDERRAGPKVRLTRAATRLQTEAVGKGLGSGRGAVADTEALEDVLEMLAHRAG